MTSEWVQQLKVPDLKDELRKRGLQVSGTKAVLASRLLESLGRDTPTTGSAAVSTPTTSSRAAALPSPVPAFPALATPPAEQTSTPTAANKPSQACAPEAQMNVASEGLTPPVNIDGPTPGAVVPAVDAGDAPAGAVSTAEEQVKTPVVSKGDVSFRESTSPTAPEHGRGVASADPLALEPASDHGEANAPAQESAELLPSADEQPVGAFNSEPKELPVVEAGQQANDQVEEPQVAQPETGAEEAAIVPAGPVESAEIEEVQKSDQVAHQEPVSDVVEEVVAPTPVNGPQPVVLAPSTEEPALVAVPEADALAAVKAKEDVPMVDEPALDFELEPSELLPDPDVPKPAPPAAEEHEQDAMQVDGDSHAAATGAPVHAAGQSSDLPGGGDGQAEEDTDASARRKRKHAPIPNFPDKKKEPVAATPPAVRAPEAKPALLTGLETRDSAKRELDSPAVARPLKQAKTDAPPPAVPEVATHTRALRIENFVRPFTEGAVRELLSQTGVLSDMWMPSIKNLCIAIFENEEQAEATRKALWNLQWPPSSIKRLLPTFVAVEEAQDVITRGRNMPRGAALTRVGSGKEAPAAAALSSPGFGAVPDVPDAPKAGSADKTRTSLVPPVQDGAKKQKRVEEPPVLTLDDLFRKTVAKPRLYYLPLTDEQAAQNQRKREAAALEGLTGPVGSLWHNGRQAPPPGVQLLPGPPRNNPPAAAPAVEVGGKDKVLAVADAVVPAEDLDAAKVARADDRKEDGGAVRKRDDSNGGKFGAVRADGALDRRGRDRERDRERQRDERDRPLRPAGRDERDRRDERRDERGPWRPSQRSPSPPRDRDRRYGRRV